ncbi:putative choline kinase [Spiroplasma clarkii]|uniref:phosphotransferase family protein n=1 Tax=Spiroplasma clarkii TaxID=2139 RepID=UPI000B556313|nr:phosphotransferase [Spiroplasma clarkii]ARU91673.1 putative choline kinase [Spiroplasma clarkii]
MFLTLDQNILVKPSSFFFEDNQLHSKFPYLSEYQSLEILPLNKAIVIKVCEIIDAFHKLNFKNAPIKKFDYLQMLEVFEKNISKPLFDYQQQLTKIKALISQFTNLDQVISHNDLVPGNILLDKNDNLKLIDYDYICLNNKFFDLASFITETCNDNLEMSHFFVKACLDLNIIHESELNLLNDCIAYQDILWTLWANYMYEVTKEQLYLEIAQDKFTRCHKREKF